jgi:hypothetical protein
MQKTNVTILSIMTLMVTIIHCSNSSESPKGSGKSENSNVFKKGYIFYTWIDKARIRENPGLKGKAIAYLDEGEEVIFMKKSDKKTEIMLRKEKYNTAFYKIKRSDGTTGWVYGGALKNANAMDSETVSSVEVPRIGQACKEHNRSFLLWYNQRNHLLALIRDYGWGGAVDGPSLNLELINCKTNKVIAKIYMETITGQGPGFTGYKPNRWRQEILKRAWKKDHKKIQALLKKYGFNKLPGEESPFKKVSSEEIGLKQRIEERTFAKEKYKSLRSILFKNKLIWDNKKFREQTGEKIEIQLASVVSISDDYYKVNIYVRNHYDCCDESISFFIDR